LHTGLLEHAGDVRLDRLGGGDVVSAARIALFQLGGAAPVKRSGAFGVEL
jgi:hypothetical protein